MYPEMGKLCNQGKADVMKCAHHVALAKCWWKDRPDGSWIGHHVVRICVMLGVGPDFAEQGSGGNFPRESFVATFVVLYTLQTCTPWKFNIAPENIPSQRKVVFQPSFFRGYVKLRGCRALKNDVFVFSEVEWYGSAWC